MKRVWQSPYSPDFNLCDRFVFSYLKKELRKSTFTSAADVKMESLRILRDLPQECYVEELQKLQRHCEDVIAIHGEYVYD